MVGSSSDPYPRPFLGALTPRPHRMWSMGVRKHLAVFSACWGPPFPHLHLKQFGQIHDSQLWPHIKISKGPFKTCIIKTKCRNVNFNEHHRRF